MISFFLIISLIFIYPNLPTYVYLPYLYLLTYLFSSLSQLKYKFSL